MKEANFGKKIFLKLIITLSIISFSISLTLAVNQAVQIKSSMSSFISDNSDSLELVFHPDMSNSKITISALLLLPKGHNKNSEALPGVIIQHGMGGLKENMLSMAINFVNRGFVVLTMDLRRHGKSNGFHTFGNKESDDIVYAVNYLKNEINGSIANISKIGLIGHSMGAISVIMASYKSGVESCVAISPAAFVNEVLSSIFGGDIYRLNNFFGTQNIFSDPNFIENISLKNYVKNRLMETPAKTKNLLLCTSIEDTVVPPHYVYDIFKNITQEEAPLNNTLYGSFENMNATQCNVYNHGDHGAEQYTFKTPDITRDAMNWTERALIGEEASLLRGEINIENFIMTNPGENAGILDKYYLISYLSISLFLISLLNYKTFGQERPIFEELPDEMNFTIFFQNRLKKFQGSKFKNCIVNMAFIVIIGLIIGLIFSKIYTPGFIGVMFSELAVRLIGLFIIPIGIFLLIHLYKMKKNVLNSPQAQIEKDFADKYKALPWFLRLGIGNDLKSILYSTLTGLIIGLYLPIGFSTFVLTLGIEQFFKPIVFWDLYLVTSGYLFIELLILEIFMYGFLARVFTIRFEKFRFLSPIYASIIQLFFAFLLSFVILIFDPILTGIFSYAGYVVPLKITGILGLTAIIFVISLIGNISAKTTKSIMLPIAFISTFVPWVLFSVLAIF